jgi:hypothetical protein
MKSILTAPVALLLAIPAAASGAVVPVTSLSGDGSVSGGQYDASFSAFTPNNAFAPMLWVLVFPC